jgi:uncharacterized protein (UPF0335 family)
MPQGRKHNQTGGVAADQLRSLIERIERLEEEKAGIANDIKEVFAEAKGNGFDTKTMKQIIRLRKMDQPERDEHEALLDIYKAALGMLNGTPLGESALRKLSGDKPKDGSMKDGQCGEAAADEKSAEKKPKKPGPTIDDAREMARKAASEGKPVTDNPFPARDPRRAAWDEEWCRSTGTDGMELPEAWRKTPKRQEKEEADDNEEAA